MPFYILEVEDINKRTLFDLHKQIIDLLKEPPIVLVLLWTTGDEKKINKYKNIIHGYFSDLGAKDVLFLNENDEDLDNKFKKANLIYLPGGDVEIFLKKLKREPKVIEKLRKFDGIIIGNSAGAIILSKYGYGHKEGKLVKYEGLGILDISVVVHFKPEDLEYIDDKEVILIGDNDYVIIYKQN